MLLDLLRAMRRQLDRLTDDMADLKAMPQEMAAHMAAFMTARNRQDDAIFRIQMPLDRIERRLDLTEEPRP